jgi:two-component system, chemotaxis family, protein-glutamate methylesterase/glutaminase
VTALTKLLASLPADLGAVVLIVQHVDPRHRSLMPQVIGRHSRLPVTHAEEGTALEPGHVYLAPPDRHMLIKRKGTLTLTDTDLVNFVRPSADLLFESVAAAYGPRAIAVVLTGSGHDGATGVSAIKQRGGMVVVQDEASSEFFGMPSAAIKTGAADYVLPLDEVATKLVTLVARQTQT